MRVPTLPSLGIRLPRLTPRLAPGQMTRLLGVALWAAFWILAVTTLAAIALFIFMAFVPLPAIGLTVTTSEGGTNVPVPRAYILFAVGAITGYLGGFALILLHLRAMLRALQIGDPFQPANVSRLKQIGVTLAVVTGGAWIGQTLVSRLVRGELEPPGLFDLVTPAFSVLVVFVLAEVFREGARLRRESELTI
ncbi:MAG: DUF2975 domain-containing protein [Brevundimonas sp.]|nr:MAG: DUF2975 domain-containing protein [Brevundimonas sp.]